MTVPASTASRKHSATVVLWVCILACAVQNIDANLISVIFPQFSKAFSSSPGGSAATLNLAASVFALALAAFILGAGRLGDIHGRKRMLSLGLIVEMAALLAAIVTPSPVLMVLVRMIGGIGAALVSVMSLAIVNAAITDPKRRARAITTFIMMLGIGPIVLPIIVQLINQTGPSSWRLTFLVPFALGAAALALLPRCVPESRNEGASRMDWLGTGLAALGLFTLIFGVSRAALPAGFASPGCYVPIAIGVLVLTVLALYSRGREWAVLPMDLLAKPVFLGGIVLAVIIYSGYVGFTFQLNNFLQEIMHVKPVAAVLWVVPAGVGFVLAGLIASRLEQRIGRRPVMTLGLVLASAGICTVTLLIGAKTSYAEVVLPMFVIGAGFLLTNAARTNAVLSVAPPERSGTASGMTNAANNVGIGFGVAISSVILSSQLGPGLHHRLEAAGLSAAQVAKAVALLKAQLVSLGDDANIIAQSGLTHARLLKLDAAGVAAYVHALHVTFFSLAGVMALGILVVVLVMRPRGPRDHQSI